MGFEEFIHGHRNYPSFFKNDNPSSSKKRKLEDNNSVSHIPIQFLVSNEDSENNKQEDSHSSFLKAIFGIPEYPITPIMPPIFQNPSYISPDLKNKKVVKESSPQFHHDYIYPEPKNKTNNFNEIVNQLGLHNEKLVELMKERIEQKELTSKEQELREENENLRNEISRLNDKNKYLRFFIQTIYENFKTTLNDVKDEIKNMNSNSDDE